MILNAPINEKSLMGIAHDIRNVARAGRSTDDDSYSLRQIIFWAKTTAAKIRAESLEKDSASSNELRADWIEEFPCLALKPIDRSHCDCVKYGCSEKYIDLPDFAQFNGDLAMTYFGTSDWRTPFTRAYDGKDASTKVMGIGRFGRPSAVPVYYIQSKRAYVVFPPEYAMTVSVSVSGVRINPLEDKPMGDTNLDRDIWCEPVPMDDGELYMLRNRILTTEMNMMVRMEPNRDDNNNANSK